MCRYQKQEVLLRKGNSIEFWQPGNGPDPIIKIDSFFAPAELDDEQLNIFSSWLDTGIKKSCRFKEKCRILFGEYKNILGDYWTCQSCPGKNGREYNPQETAFIVKIGIKEGFIARQADRGFLEIIKPEEPEFLSISDSASSPLVVMEKMEKKIIDDCSQLAGLKVGEIVLMNLAIIQRNPEQPRKIFDEEEIRLKGESIAEKGDVNKEIEVTLRYREDRSLFPILVDGEMRIKGGKLVDATHLSTKIRESMTDKQLFVASVVANFNKTDMNPIEEALAIKKMMEENEDMDKAKVGTLLSRSIGTINNVLKYLKLSEKYQDMLIKGQITKGEALALARVNPEYQDECFGYLINEIEKKGKKLSQTELDRATSNFMKKHKIKPQNKRRDRLNSQEKIIAAVSRTVEKLTELLEELGELTSAEIRSCQKVSPFNLLEAIEGLIPSLQKHKNYLDKLVG